MSVRTQIVHAKLSPPQVGIKTFRRARLDSIILDEHLPKLVLISAPAGYGKTTTLVQWHAILDDGETRVAWLSLDEEDGDANVFLAHAIAALSRAGCDFGSLGAAAMRGLPRIKPNAAINGLLNAVDSSGVKTVLFLDDYHRTFSTTVASTLETLVERMPANFHIVLAGRGHPGICVSKLRMKGQVKELSRADIRFNSQEALAYLDEQLDDTRFRSVLDQVDGWPVGLHLFKMAGGGDLASLREPEAFPTGMIELQEYWVEQVLSGLDSDYPQVLMDISFLDRVSGDLLNVVCERRDGWSLLEEFERRDLFILPLDPDRNWFEFHHLFRSYLQKRLRRFDPERVAEIHRKAACWGVDAGELQVAFHHATALEKPDLIIDFLDRLGGFNACLRGGTPAVRMFSKLPGHVTRANARLWLGRIYYLGQRGRIDEAQEEYDELEKATANFTKDINKDADESLAAEGYTIYLLIKAYKNSAVPPAQIKEKIAEFERVEGFPSLLRGWLKEMLGWQHYMAGELHEAIRVGLQSSDLCKETESWFLFIYSRIYVGLAWIELAASNKAKAELESVIEDSEELFGPKNNSTIMPRVALAQLAYWARDWDTAERLLDEAQDYLADGEIWFDCLASAHSTAVALAQYRPWVSNVANSIERFIGSISTEKSMWLSEMVQTYQLREAAKARRSEDIKSLLDAKFFKEIINGKLTTEICGWRLWQPAAGAIIRGSLVIGDITTAKSLLDRLTQAIEGSQQIVARAKLQLLRAAFLDKCGDRSAASALLQDSFGIVPLREHWQVFVDESSGLVQVIEEMLGRSDKQFALEHRRLLEDMLAKGKKQGCTEDQEVVEVASLRTPLSNRENTVLHLIWDGFSTKEISRKLQLSEGTVKVYRKRLYAKLNVHCRSEAIAAGRRLAILPITDGWRENTASLNIRG